MQRAWQSVKLLMVQMLSQLCPSQESQECPFIATATSVQAQQQQCQHTLVPVHISNLPNKPNCSKWWRMAISNLCLCHKLLSKNKKKLLLAQHWKIWNSELSTIMFKKLEYCCVLANKISVVVSIGKKTVRPSSWFQSVIIFHFIFYFLSRMR